MAFHNCFGSSKKKKKDKGEIGSFSYDGSGNNVRNLQVKLEHLQKSLEPSELKQSSFSVQLPCQVQESSECKAADSGEVNYEGGDEQDTLKMKTIDSDHDLEAHIENSNDGSHVSCTLDVDDVGSNVKMPENDLEDGVETLDGENASDPGVGKAKFWGSPKLKRSCSDLVMRNTCQELIEQLHIGKSKSYEDMIVLAERYRESVPEGDATSPVTVKTLGSADRVILKKHSSSQILPSGSRKLWWKLFMWSHRNVYRAGDDDKAHSDEIDPAVNLHGGYSSDTIEPSQGQESSKIRFQSPLSIEGMGKVDCKTDDQRWDEFYGASGMWPQNQWVAFPTESSSLARVDEWVKEISVQTPFRIEKDECAEDGFDLPPSPDNGVSHTVRNPSGNAHSEMISHANSVIRSLNASSSVAHMAGIQLKVIPSISHFSSLRSVNLSGNLIAHITPGSLPKGLHVLNLSKNKINTIEGLRDLTRLRVIDLSYNRISRIGRGLSNCMLVKELYLAGNKVSVVEGLHRLLKLTVLDLSFNKITTTKAIGQLVANYHSLAALNLLGNPIQASISEDQLRKTVCGFLPKLALLNKQPIDVQKARAITTDATAKAVLGSNSNSRSVRRKVASSRRGTATGPTTSRQRSKGHSHGRYLGKDKA